MRTLHIWMYPVSSTNIITKQGSPSASKTHEHTDAHPLKILKNLQKIKKKLLNAKFANYFFLAQFDKVLKKSNMVLQQFQIMILPKVFFR